MNKVIHAANEYKSQITLLDIGLLKLCLMSLGVLLGVAVPKGHKKKAAAGASIAFAFTYAPLMTKFLTIVLKQSDDDK